MHVDVLLPVRYSMVRLDYERGVLDTVARRNSLFFEPSLSLRNKWGTSSAWQEISFNYKFFSTAASLSYMLNYRDNSAPLTVRLGNPDLKDAHTHNAQLAYSNNNYVTNRLLNTALIYNYWENMLCQSMIYDPTTGVRTYRPDVINGNWSLSGKVNYSAPLKFLDNIKFFTNTSIDHRKSVDMATIADAPNSVRSKVRNTVFNERARIEYNRGMYYLGATVDFILNHSEGDRLGTINVFTYNYGLYGNLPLPWNMSLNSRITMYNRKGFEDSNFNSNELIWNARLDKSVLKGKLNFTIEAFDILNNISDVSYIINAQMQRETYRNVLGRNVMLHVSYKFNIEPKNKNK